MDHLHRKEQSALRLTRGSTAFDGRIDRLDDAPARTVRAGASASLPRWPVCYNPAARMASSSLAADWPLSGVWGASRCRVRSRLAAIAATASKLTLSVRISASSQRVQRTGEGRFPDRHRCILRAVPGAKAQSTFRRIDALQEQRTMTLLSDNVQGLRCNNPATPLKRVADCGFHCWSRLCGRGFRPGGRCVRSAGQARERIDR